MGKSECKSCGEKLGLTSIGLCGKCHNAKVEEFDHLKSFEEKADYLMDESENATSSFDKIDLQIKSISWQNKEIIKLLQEQKNGN